MSTYISVLSSLLEKIEKIENERTHTCRENETDEGERENEIEPYPPRQKTLGPEKQHRKMKIWEM